jgi:hypothetical protein
MPTMNDIATSYVKLVLAVGQHDPDYVDAFYGPPAWKQEAEAKKRPMNEIRGEAERLLAALAGQPAAAGKDAELLRLRHEYLTRQLQALAARVDLLSGKKMTFDEESKALYDAVAPTYGEAHFQGILDELGALLPGDGPLVDRLERFRLGFEIPRDRLGPVFDAAIAECRRRTREHIDLPAEESFAVEYVTDKPWSAYNWYKGGSHSLIQVNTDLPIFIDRAIDLACHEGYPGHHVYNALLEQHLVNERGWPETSVYPLFSPQSLIAEGTANFGIEVARHRRPLLPGPGPDAEAELCRQRGRPPLSRRPDRPRPGRRLADAVCLEQPREVRAARALLRTLPQLCHQLQPRSGPGEGLRGEEGRHGGSARKALADLHRADLLTPPCVGPAVRQAARAPHAPPRPARP